MATMNEKKIEKVTYASALTAVIDGQTLTPEIVEKLVALRASIEKKNNAERKPTKAQVANDGVKQAILDGLANAENPLTIGEMIKTIPALEGLSSQKVSALVRQLVEGGLLTRTEDKRKAYFSLPEVED